MTRGARIAAIATGCLTGLAILLLTEAPGLGGAIFGISITTAAAMTVIQRHAARLNAAAHELADTRAQYEAAHATLAGQRERMRADFEGRLAEHVARLNAAHQADIFQTQRDWYTLGATDALTGRLATYEPPAEASVIRLNSHRPLHTTPGTRRTRY